MSLLSFAKYTRYH